MKPNLNKILKAVLKEFKMSAMDFEILRHTRVHSVIQVMQAVSLIASEAGHKPLAIGGFLGKDRTTIIYNVKQMKGICDVYPDMREKLDKVRQELAYDESHMYSSYIARSHSGLLTISPGMPVRMAGYWVAEGSKPYKDQNAFPQITWVTEPVKVTIKVSVDEQV